MSFKVNDPKGAAGSLKAPMWLVPPVALEELAWVLKLGSEKYGAYNWRATGVCASTYISAAFRHLNAWRDGEDLDPESGRSHLAHAMTCFAIVLDAEKCGTLDDDRNKLPAIVDELKTVASYLRNNTPERANSTYCTSNIVPTSPVSLKALAEIKDALNADGVFVEPTTPTPNCPIEGYVFDEGAPRYDFTGECYCGHRLVRDHKGNDICENCENYYDL
jgi:hypothetical protein